MVVRMRHTRAHTRNRRSHHALANPALVKCQDCGAMRIRHQACSSCGRYRGRVVIDVAHKAMKRAEKATKKSAGAPAHDHAHEGPAESAEKKEDK